MKKLFTLLISIVLLLSCTALAESLDYSAMSNDQLKAIIEQAQNELARRNGDTTEKYVLFDTDGVSAHFTGNHEVWGYDTHYVTLEAIVVNESNVTVAVMADTACINGWNVSVMGLSELSAGKKEKIGIDLNLSDADITTFEEIEELEISFYFYDPETYMTTKKLDPVTFTF